MDRTIICVLRSGGAYTPEHVSLLHKAIQKHSSARLLCLSDVPVGCDREPLQHRWPSWWSKMEMYRLPQPFLYLDLDTVIVGNINHLFSRTESLITLSTRFGGIGSGVMWVNCGDRPYRTFLESPNGWRRRTREEANPPWNKGDQRFLELINCKPDAYWKSVLPGQILSYKKDLRGKELPSDCRIVYFHGRPNPWDIDEPWLDNPGK